MKPVIRYVDGVWECHVDGERQLLTGFGVDPADAYDDWLAWGRP